MGTAIEMADQVRLVIEMKPVISNFTGTESAWKTFRIGAFMGLMYDF
ncbi:MAG: hypothetical protein WCK42_03435 [Myxococcaceae bacterium]